MARPSKYDTHVKPRLTEITDWVRNGATDKQIAENLKISPDTLIEYKKQYSEFSECLKNTRAYVDAQVENALLKRALDGDITAQIFWLKNRRPSKWRDRPKEEDDDKESQEVKITIERKLIDLSKRRSGEDASNTL